MTELNLVTWHSNRQLSYIPAHFIVVEILITAESYTWILEKTTGRYALADIPGASFVPQTYVQDYGYYPAFENISDAVYFGLIWTE